VLWQPSTTVIANDRVSVLRLIVIREGGDAIIRHYSPLRKRASPDTLREPLEGWQNGYCTSLENWRPQGLLGSNPRPSVPTYRNISKKKSCCTVCFTTQPPMFAGLYDASLSASLTAARKSS
jgi:hypothetical protein